MAYYIYIIESLVDHSYYKGFSENPALRLLQHNNGDSAYTSHKCPWILVYVEICETKRDALIREKNLKKATKERITALIAAPKNIVDQFAS